MLIAHKFQVQKILASVADRWPGLELSSLMKLIEHIPVEDEEKNREGYLRMVDYLGSAFEPGQ